MINTYYYIRGGAETCVDNTSNLLEQHGHTVIPFAMHHRQNRATPFENYFVSEIDFAAINQRKSLRTALRVAMRCIYSGEAMRCIERLITDHRPDVAHLHGIHAHLTLSILRSLKKYNIPITWTLHDYRTICPNTNLLSHGKICEACKKRKFYMAPLTRCKKGSFLASLMACVETSFNRFSGLYKNVSQFIVPSRFLQSKLTEFGFYPDRLAYLPHFLFLDQYEPQTDFDKYFVFLGRLSVEKGLRILLEAMSGITGMNLKLIGDGPQRPELKSVVQHRVMDNVEFLGYKTGDELQSLLKRAAFVVLPSTCYENAPYSVLEAFAYGKPVVGSRLGGIAEMIGNNGECGLLFEPNNANDLKEKLSQIISDPARIVQMGANARRKMDRLYSAESHYPALANLYETL